MKNLLYIITIFLFAACGASTKTLKPVSQAYEVTEDKQVLDLIAPYKAQFEAEMSEVVGVTAYELLKQKPEGKLNNFLADAVLQACQNLNKNPIDFCVLNYGGIRLPALPEGNISKSMIYELLPFDNYMVVLNMTPEMLQQLFDHIVAKGAGWPISKQVHFKLDSVNQQASNIKINNEDIGSKQNYQVLMPDYIANGGDDCRMLKSIPQHNLNILIRDAMLSYLKINKDTIAPNLEKRMYYE